MVFLFSAEFTGVCKLEIKTIFNKDVSITEKLGNELTFFLFSISKIRISLIKKRDCFSK
jgi:hypothetical protein